jgi:hypothetical protein
VCSAEHFVAGQLSTPGSPLTSLEIELDCMNQGLDSRYLLC